LGLAVAAVLFGAGSASANAVFTASGSNGGNPLSASADFSIVGGNLQIVLTNTSTLNGVNETPTETLSGLRFDITGQSGTLSPLSALASSVYNPAACSPASACSGLNVNVGGEWGYQFNNLNITQDNLIGSAGYVTTTSGNPGNFGGPDLDNHVGLNGIDFAILASSHDALTNGLQNGSPLSQSSVTFLLAGLPNNFALTDISNVAFQYGTSLTEPSVGGGCGTQCGGSGGPGPGPDVPEPATLLLLASAMFGYGAVRRREQRS